MKKLTQIVVLTFLAIFLLGGGSALGVILSENVAKEMVSEPFAMFLLGFGLIGVAAFGRRSFQQ